MPRIVSVWLPRWPIQRFLSAQARKTSSAPVDPQQPFVLIEEGPGGGRITAVNATAEHAGLAAGEALADARAKAGYLQVRNAERAADDLALRRLTLWATRYTPTASPWDAADGADGFFLDITGAAHLFGGEARLLTDLSERLARFGLPVRLAIAETAGMAWALSRFHATPSMVLAAGTEAATLAPLPVEALRLSRDTCITLRRLGFKRIGALIDAPRAPFAARFENELLLRLDQALGRAPEPLRPIVAPPVYHSLRYLMEPILSQDAVITVAARLMRDLDHPLLRDGVGARALRLTLYRVNGEVASFDIGMTRPTRSVEHVAKLIALKLERIPEMTDVDFGFEAVGLAVTVAEEMQPEQTEMASVADEHDPERCAALIDRLKQKLGARNVQRLSPVESHLPERAEVRLTATCEAPAWASPDATRERPLVLLPQAEPAEVMALVPEGPPQRFRWRGVLHAITGAQGPERIAAEWWRAAPDAPTRDYYLVEDEDGRRFWLYREGLYERETMTPRWFVHGLFA